MPTSCQHGHLSHLSLFLNPSNSSKACDSDGMGAALDTPQRCATATVAPGGPWHGSATKHMQDIHPVTHNLQSAPKHDLQVAPFPYRICSAPPPNATPRHATPHPRNLQAPAGGPPDVWSQLFACCEYCAQATQFVPFQQGMPFQQELWAAPQQQDIPLVGYSLSLDVNRGLAAFTTVPQQLALMILVNVLCSCLFLAVRVTRSVAAG